MNVATESYSTTYGVRKHLKLKEGELFIAAVHPLMSSSLIIIIDVVVIIIISGSTVLVRILAASHQTFRYVIKTLSMTSLSE
jgi:hypothetical protein